MKTVDYTPRHKWDEKLGLSPGTIERIVHGSPSWRKAQTGLITPDAYRADIAQQLNLSIDDVQQLMTDFYSGDVLDTDLVDYVKTLRENDYTVALLSNDSIELTDKLRRLEIDNLFDPLVISAYIGVMKPDARAYELVLEEVACSPSEAVFIDDMPQNIAGAEAVGIQGIHYRNGMDIAAAVDSLLKLE